MLKFMHERIKRQWGTFLCTANWLSFIRRISPAGHTSGLAASTTLTILYTGSGIWKSLNHWGYRNGYFSFWISFWRGVQNHNATPIRNYTQPLPWQKSRVKQTAHLKHTTATAKTVTGSKESMPIILSHSSKTSSTCSWFLRDLKAIAELAGMKSSRMLLLSTIALKHRGTACTKITTILENLFALVCVIKKWVLYGRPRGWTPPLPRQTVSITLQPHQLLIPAPFQDLKSVLGGWFFAF